jgi:hypothetical protein
MSDEPKKPPMPPQPSTKQLPAMTDRALLEDLARTVKEGFAASAANDTLITAEVRRAQSDIRGLRHEVNDLQDWRNQVQGVVMPRLDTHSIKVQRISDHDMEQDGKLSEQIIKVSAAANEIEALKKTVSAINAKQDVQTAILVRGEEAAKKIWENKAVKALAAALFFWLLHWLDSKGIKVTP